MAPPPVVRAVAPPVVRVVPAPTPVVRVVPAPTPVVRVAPNPAPTTVVGAAVQTQSPIVIVAPPVARTAPVPPPTPANSPMLTFRQTPADILVLENHDILYTIPYKSSYRTTEEYYRQTLDSIGTERFKQWVAEQVRANQMLK